MPRHEVLVHDSQESFDYVSGANYHLDCGICSGGQSWFSHSVQFKTIVLNICF